MAKSNKQKNQKRKQKQKQNKKKGKRFLDGLTVGVSMPGSTNRVASGNTKGGSLNVANKKRNLAPVALGTADMTVSARVRNQGDGATISGRDFLTPINVNNHVVGDVRYTMPITPFMLPQSRLAALATIYEKWRIRKLIFHYVTAVATSQAGQLIHYVDYDVTNRLSTSSQSNVNIASAHSKSTPFSVWNDSKLSYGRAGQWLYTNNNGDDDRWDSAGLYTVICATNFGGDVDLGSIYVEYDIDFFQGQAATPSSGNLVTGVYGYAVGPTLTNPLGTDVTYVYNNLGVTYDGAGKFTFPSQLGTEHYTVSVIMMGSSTFGGTTSWTTGGNCQASGLVPGGATTLHLTGDATTPNVRGVIENIEPNLLTVPMTFAATTSGITGGGTLATLFFINPSKLPVAKKGVKAKLEELYEKLDDRTRQLDALTEQVKRMMSPLRCRRGVVGDWGETTPT